MGVELDLSELAVLRPIQTAASSGGAATPRRGNDGPDAADTGCVTPTAMGSLLPRPGAFGVGVALDVVEAVFSTPTSSPCLLRPATVCPPAPRKPARAPAAAAKRKRCCDLPGLSFFPVPQDLSTVFVPRGPAADRSPPPPRGAKKIRRLFVVG
ncbi:hypothetical protein SEVIR_4G158400v4 [Setaria viridis]|uniref:Uncharacterized protein n=2 Tax=Setaria TaxID=4554 RepID=A0A368QVY0_SETIT|nr:uncharacterized protein LOC101754591 [Setaria italica]XP_034589590.1 uncharacterized protein LOC117851799 [Setaria viridis]RCV22062.1 hypothetical protein SETIT_4G189900v2 [Setaria italica]TKW21996.1 hypothetical protein SEVIR_4G158400v2 [Setaria viridis]